MPPKLPKLKRNPWKIVQDAQRKLSANPGRPAPVWVNAISAVPMGPKPYASLTEPNNSIQFENENAPTLKLIYEKQRNDSMRMSRNKNASLGRSQYVTKPPLIVYDEDEIRKTFYNQHPFELDRPRSLVFDENVCYNASWTSIYGGDQTTRIPLSGESVVQRTLFLHIFAPDNEKITDINLAYKRALSEFYQARREEEAREKKARLLAYQTGIELRKQEEAAKLAEMNQQRDRSAHHVKIMPSASTEYYFGRPNAKQFMETERKEVYDGIKYRKELIDIAKSSSGPSNLKR